MITKEEAIKKAYDDHDEEAERNFEYSVRKLVDKIESLSNQLRKAKLELMELEYTPTTRLGDLE